MTDAAHSHLGPSSSDRWIACPGSINLVQALPLDTHVFEHDTESEYSTEGTLAHHVLAKALQEDLEAWEVAELCSSEDMAITISASLDRLRAFIADLAEAYDEEPEVFIEQRVTMFRVHRDCWGTLDLGLYFPKAQRVGVLDFKYGAGKWVEAKNNPQLLLYTVGLIDHLDIGRDNGPNLWGDITFGTYIYQPRMSEHIRSGTSGDGLDLLEWITEVPEPALTIARSYPPQFKAGSHCRYCPAALFCPVLRSEIEAIDLGKNPSAFTEEVLSGALQRAEFVSGYVKRLQGEAYNRLVRGKTVPGYKLVDQKGHRKWKDGAESVLVDKLKDRAYTAPVLISPAQAEKLGAKDVAKQWAEAPVTGTRMVPEEGHTEQPRVNRKPADVFSKES